MPRDTLTRDEIVSTAVELLDEEGLDGLNMRSLGRRLGAAATAVYWHVKNKDDILLLAGDHVWDEVETPDLAAVDWRTAATRMAASLHAMFVRHPWLVQALGSYLLYGPRKARHDEHSLAVFEAAGFRDAAADRAAAAVFTYVLGNVLGTSALDSLTKRLNRTGKNAEELIGEAMTQAREIAMGFPRLRIRVDAPSADYNMSPEDTFEYGLRALLDGLEADLRHEGRPV
ncbi:TetR/AcrR family transcriptional regulator C-terminal domain-containing protein [Streptosporangium soli]|nr:TetR/AcrR family transcriptional regulator C-terminal domain-containing protein [Streptosporangium sp. KLBMP 9127]